MFVFQAFLSLMCLLVFHYMDNLGKFKFTQYQADLIVLCLKIKQGVISENKKNKNFQGHS